MKKWMMLVLTGSLLLAIGCGKNDTASCTNVDPATEENALVAYGTAQGFSLQKDTTTGMYYQIVTPGTGVRPSASSTVTARYVGKRLDGTVFDQSSASGTQFPLSNVILGWQRGLPLIRVGGTIRLLIPSAYAYGCRGSGDAIPSNAPLFFEVTLLAVN